MRKIFALLTAVMLVASMAVAAYAVTPTLNVPNIPEIPEIKPTFETKLSESFWSDWFTRHPFKIDFSFQNIGN